MSEAPSHRYQQALEKVLEQVSSVLLGKRRQIKLALACLIARGHLLIEDLPGMGKTTLAQGLAQCLGLSFKRVQFTSDLLPADILGFSVYEQQSEHFVFHPGPIFSQLLLADEINRTTPKTQSALLEAMSEGQVTVEGETRPLPQPFFVIATQNPVSQSGTYPLPESQLDRFAMCLSLGYPDLAAEKKMLLGGDPRRDLAKLSPCLKPGELQRLQKYGESIHVSEVLADYLLRLVHYTRAADDCDVGLSPRAALAVLQCARGWAMLEGRNYVIPEDVQNVFPVVARHRLQTHGDPRLGGAIVERALNTVDIL